MPELLRVDASIRDMSVSREVADTFERDWVAGQDGARVSRRDLRDAAPGYLTERGEAAVAATLVDEILDADLLLLAAPMYNWSVPAALRDSAARSLRDACRTAGETARRYAQPARTI